MMWVIARDLINGVEDTGNGLSHKILLCERGRCADDWEIERTTEPLPCFFLRDRVAKEKFHCQLFGKIKRIVDEYAKGYEERFAEIAKSQAMSSYSWR